MTSKCPHCDMIHGPRCPSVKAIEYYPDGTIKRVEYMTLADYMRPLAQLPLADPSPINPWQPTVTYTA